MFPVESPGRSRLELLGRRRGSNRVIRKGSLVLVTKVNHFYNGWQDDRKFLSLFYNPGAAFMDCIWLQSAIIRLIVLHENQEQIPEFVKANGVS